MIVKVVPVSQFEATVFQADFGPVTLGTWYFDDPAGQRTYGGSIVPEGRRENVHTHCIGVTEGDVPDVKRATPDSGQWKIRYAWWQEPHQVTLVVTSGEIYLLSDKGDTVDRVR